MKTKRNLIKLLSVAAVALAVLAGTGSVSAEQNSKLALIPGGPHPYFAAWEPAGQAAMKDFNLAAPITKSRKSGSCLCKPQLLESLVAQGYNGFMIFPGDPVGSNGTVSDLVAEGANVIALAGCLVEPTDALFCLGTDTGQLGLSGDERTHQGDGRKGQNCPLHGLFGLTPNTQLRIDAVQQAADEAGGGVEVVQVIADIDAS